MTSSELHPSHIERLVLQDAASHLLEESKSFRTVLRFAFLMEQKLAKNRHKGSDRRRWLEQDPAELMERLGHEFKELTNAIADREEPEAIALEAADVANFAMMIADHYIEAAKGPRPPWPLTERLNEKLKLFNTNYPLGMEVDVETDENYIKTRICSSGFIVGNDIYVNVINIKDAVLASCISKAREVAVEYQHPH